MRAGIALGSNLGDRAAHLRTAVEQIIRLPMVRTPLLASSVYETEPVDCAPDAPKFLNAVIEVECEREPGDLMHRLRRIEESLGRIGQRAHHEPRVLDLDLLYLGDTQVDGPSLTLPHPRMLERRFVLEPLAEIRPDLVLPGQTQNVAEFLVQLPATTPLVRVPCQW
ncbi:MAG: 2-amino-4-hydroxy-6-hydroxymethyldihydropteridine diphosphokinase [Verrucomicrobiota bacterium]|nr:2-amino-4-hydroxy-6-hydroxymethyldihydropteridine diphosphokinase [Verrucomicrobiota bacterium]